MTRGPGSVGFESWKGGIFTDPPPRCPWVLQPEAFPFTSLCPCELEELLSQPLLGGWSQDECALPQRFVTDLCRRLPRLRWESRAQAWAVSSVAPSTGMGWLNPALLPLGSDSQTRSGQGLNRPSRATLARWQSLRQAVRARSC